MHQSPAGITDRILSTRIHAADVEGDAQPPPHPDQRRLLQVPDFDQAPGTAAVNRRSVDPHTLDRSRVLEVTFLHMFPRLKAPHWQRDSKCKAHTDASFRTLVTTLSKYTTETTSPPLRFLGLA